MDSSAPTSQVQQLKEFSVCAMANALERLQIRLKNEGFTTEAITRFTGGPQPAIGYASTLKIKCSSPPVDAQAYIERTNWWDYLIKLPAPHFLVIEDVDSRPGSGALVGEVHAHILKALGCVAVATNGAVRDVAEVQPMGFSMFAKSLSVSHAYSHIVDANCRVVINGLSISPGDLIAGDQHGLIQIPTSIVPDLIRLAKKNIQIEKQIINNCQAPTFTVESLRETIRGFRSS